MRGFTIHLKVKKAWKKRAGSWIVELTKWRTLSGKSKAALILARTARLPWRSVPTAWPCTCWSVICLTGSEGWSSKDDAKASGGCTAPEAVQDRFPCGLFRTLPVFPPVQILPLSTGGTINITEHAPLTGLTLNLENGIIPSAIRKKGRIMPFFVLAFPALP